MKYTYNFLVRLLANLPEAKIGKEMAVENAFLGVDVQNDFCPGGALAVTDGDQVVMPCNKMIDHAWRNNWRVLLSRDWHPRKTTHFAEFGGKWPVHCVQDTSGAEFHRGLKTDAATTIEKGKGENEDAYSPFDGCTSWGKSLHDYLLSHGVKDLYVGGLATDYCVKAACLDAVKRGYKVYLLLDACRAVNVNPGDGDKAVEEMVAAGVIVTTTDAVINGEDELADTVPASND